MKKRPNWPAYVEESNGRIIYRPRIKGAPPVSYRAGTRGKLSPAIKLGKVGDDDLTILRNYLKVRDTIFEGIAPKSTWGKISLLRSEPSKIDPNCEIRLGVASWGNGSNTAISVKYTWFDKNGHTARGAKFRLNLSHNHMNLQ